MISNALNFGIPNSQNVREEVISHFEISYQFMTDYWKRLIRKKIRNKILKKNTDGKVFNEVKREKILNYPMNAERRIYFTRKDIWEIML